MRHKSFGRDLGDVLALTRAYAGVGTAADVALVGRVAAAAEAAPPCTSIGGLDLGAGDLEALRARFPLAVSLRGYGRHLSPDERAELVRPLKGYPHSFGWYRPEHNAGASPVTVLHITELPLRKTTQSFLKDLRKAPRARLISEVDDYSSDTRVDIRVRLAPGAWDEICQGFGTREADPLEDFLLLRSSLRPFLNYYGWEGNIVEFGDDYHALFFYWAPVRRDLYRRRLERETVLLRLKIRLEREILRYTDAVHDVDLAQKADEEAASAALSLLRFPRFAAGLLHAPRYTPTNQIEGLVTAGTGASHDYILSLPARDLVRSAREKRETKVLGMEARLAEISRLLAERPFAGASLWAAEIGAVAAAIARGEKTRWRF